MKTRTSIKLILLFAVCVQPVARCLSQNAQPNLNETTAWLTDKIASYGLPYDTEENLVPYKTVYQTGIKCINIQYAVRWSSIQPQVTAYNTGFVYVDKYSTSYLTSTSFGYNAPSEDRMESLKSGAKWRMEENYSSDIYSIPYNKIQRVECNVSDQSITIYTVGNDIGVSGKPNNKNNVYIKFDFSKEQNLPQRIRNAIDNIKKLTASKEAF